MKLKTYKVYQIEDGLELMNTLKEYETTSFKEAAHLYAIEYNGYDGEDNLLDCSISLVVKNDKNKKRHFSVFAEEIIKFQIESI